MMEHTFTGITITYDEFIKFINLKPKTWSNTYLYSKESFHSVCCLHKIHCYYTRRKVRVRRNIARFDHIQNRLRLVRLGYVRLFASPKCGVLNMAESVQII